MNRARARALLVLVALLCAALLGLLLVDRGPPGAVPGPGPTTTAEPAGQSPLAAPAPPAPTAPDPTAAPTRAPVRAGLVRVSGRLVPWPLEWAWVTAIAVEGDPPEIPEEESDGPHPDLVVGADGVPTATNQRRDLIGPRIGRPNGRWAVPYGATRVGQDGAFVLDLAPGEWVLLAGARGRRTRAESVRLEHDVDVTWSLEATPAATLALTCLAAGGEPLAGGVLELHLCIDDPTGDPQPTPCVAAVGSGPWGPLSSLDDYTNGAPDIAAELDGSGTALLELPPGRYRLEGALSATARRGSACAWPRAMLFVPEGLVELVAGERRAITLRQAETREATVVVTARDPSGAPIAGALVQLAETCDAPASRLLALGGAATTGPDGRATFLEVATGAWFVVARRGTRCGRRGPERVLTAAAPHALDVVLDDEEAIGDLVVRLLDDGSGAPRVEDECLALEDREGEPTCVGPGTYRFGDVPAGQHTLIVGAERRASRLVAVEVVAGASTDLEVGLPPAAQLAGRVVGPAGAARRTHLRLRARAAPRAVLCRSWTDEQGRFRFERGAGAEPLLLEVHVSGAFPVTFAVEPPLDDLTLTLPADELTEVRVLDTTGAPVAREDVTAWVGPDFVEIQRTDPDGRALFRGPPPPGAVFEVDGVRHHVPVSGSLVVRVPPRRQTPYPPRTLWLGGTVLGPDGEPVVGAPVRSHCSNGTSTSTDERGAFEVRVVAGEVTDVTARRADLGQVAATFTIPDAGEPASVVLRIPASVQVRVRAPARATSVSAEPREHRALLRAASDYRRKDGCFDLGLLAPGRWRVVAYDALLEEVSAREVEVAGPGPLVIALE